MSDKPCDCGDCDACYDRMGELGELPEQQDDDCHGCGVCDACVEQSREQHIAELEAERDEYRRLSEAYELAAAEERNNAERLRGLLRELVACTREALAAPMSIHRANDAHRAADAAEAE